MVFLSDRALATTSRFPAQRPGTPAPALAPKETGDSPEFPDYPSEHMPRSQIPVVSRPAGLGAGRTAAFHSLQLSALGPVARTYPLTTTIHFSGFNSAACVLALPLLRTPSLDDRTSVRLPTRWLAFGRLGLVGFRRRTHWVTMTSFKGVTPIPSSRACLGTSSAWLGVSVIKILIVLSMLASNSTSSQTTSRVPKQTRRPNTDRV